MLVIAETLALLVDAEVLARIGGAIGEAARERQREVAKLDEKTSRAKRASWLAAARVPIPPGLRGIDRSWVEHAIASVATFGASGAWASGASASGASASATSASGALASASRVAVLERHARRVLADGPVSADDVWLARWLCSSFPWLPVIDAAITRPRSIAAATRMTPVALRAWLEDVGADQIAFAIGAPATAISSRLGAAAVRIAKAPRLGELGERRAAIERARIGIDETALLRVGARTIAPYVGELERLQLAVRLPREVGMLAELEAFAGSTGAPSWRAVTAP